MNSKYSSGCSVQGAETPRTARPLATLLLCTLLSVTGCKWFTDFKQTPSVGTWQHFSTDSAAGKGFRGQPSGSVPTHGSAVPGFAISYSNLPATTDSFNVIRNPVAADARSLANGRKYYAINCAVCHGDAGDAKSNLAAVNPAYGFSPSLLGDLTKGRADGYIWGKIRNGGPLMPSYNRIEEMDRWDVVNYVRGLQGKLDAPVLTGPLGLPGETGDKLPGATRTGPTVPSKYVKPSGAAASPGEKKAEGQP